MRFSFLLSFSTLRKKFFVSLFFGGGRMGDELADVTCLFTSIWLKKIKFSVSVSLL